MHRIGRGRDEIKPLVKALGRLIPGMHREGTYSGNVGGLQSPLHRVP